MVELNVIGLKRHCCDIARSIYFILYHKKEVFYLIFDRLNNASQYYHLGERLEQGLKYLLEKDFSKMEPGRYDIDGDKIYALVQEYDTRKRSDGKWEAHRRYIDIQYISEGIELMGYENLENMEAVEEEYNSDKDVLFLKGDGSFVKMPIGMFTILWPQDVHMPGQAVSGPSMVRKVVIKVLIG